MLAAISLLLCTAQAWDGCSFDTEFRCGDKCIHTHPEHGDEDTHEGRFENIAKCNCGGTVFGAEDTMWCCSESPCQVRRGKPTHSEPILGEIIEAVCTGKALNLTEACNGQCNFFGSDTNRNYGGVRSYVPCSTNVPGSEATQCIPESFFNDGTFHCSNRADEEPFKTNDKNNSAFLDLDAILIPCKTPSAVAGFKCSGTLDGRWSGCLPLNRWCNTSHPYSCDEELSAAPSQLSSDSLVCSNQSFWEGIDCSPYDDGENWRLKGGWSIGFLRCKGKTPGPELQNVNLFTQTKT